MIWKKQGGTYEYCIDSRWRKRLAHRAVYSETVYQHIRETDHYLHIRSIPDTPRGGRHDVLKGYAAAGITKLRWVVGGGENGQSSARNALLTLENVCKEEDIVIIHDAVRPMISQEIITDCIEKAKQYGSGLSAIRCQETIMRTEDGEAGHVGIDRNDIMRVQTPQAYRYGRVLWAHREALKRGITNAVYTNTLMMELGEELHFSYGSNKNIKITTLEDIDIFKALYATKRDAWLKGK